MNQNLPSPQDFDRLSSAHTLIPVYRTITADLETPVSAFLRLAEDAPEAFLLESVEGGEHVGRYTFMGIAPYKKMTARGRRITVEQNGEERTFDADIFEELKLALAGHKPARLPGLPPFTAGAVGFFSYDVVRLIEKLPALAVDELGVPDACLMFFDQVIAFDHVKKEMLLIATVDLGREGTYAGALTKLDGLERLLDAALPASARMAKPSLGPLGLVSRTTKEDFLASVGKAKEYIASGDVFQCVLSQRFDCIPGVAAFDVYRALRIVNPSPYMFFLRFGMEVGGGSAQASDARPPATDSVAARFSEPGSGAAQDWVPGLANLRGGTERHVAHIVGSSPELLVRCHNRQVEYRPIAGTRRRSADEVEDRALEADLRADEKEVAEHIMLVDLGRNDVGRVSEFGTVRVKDLMFVERYSHVMHLVSAIEGSLKQGLEAIDAFKACFPAGTLSGAPKIRAMEIIEELEPARRGVYGGSIFYADFSGNLDSCIAIRTLFMHGEQGHIQAGAGIVADSIAELEFAECGNKAAAVVRAIERARGV
jgi:anthranilate synthase component 1